ncbi:MAG: hypothetical protein CO129_04225 [Ignavibacteriales bacterium CG_4_9_14_3_um_filter_34_10]|nr:MAG: hypothetical protein CO129_04225 [Ignavibacteriales bacterium CG_4_9_14_3_um_filter_34_10]
MSKKLLALLTIILLSSNAFAQDNFSRSAVIDLPAPNPGGVGEIVAGVDFDGDGKMEIYAVNDNWNDTPDELVPMIYKYELNNGAWEVVWWDSLDIPLQNTWPALTSGDLDGDGKMEIIWGVVNFLNATTNPNPSRIIVYESKGDGSDAMGADDGAGGYKPNARWNFNLADMTNMRPFKWTVTDIDNDGTQEVVLADRAGSSSSVKVGVVSVSEIPDAGDGSETWTLEFASSLGTPGYVRSGVIEAPANEPGGYGEVVSGVDLDGDGKMEIYAVNDNWNDTPDELIPRIYKYEWNGAYWEIVWKAVLDIPLQNTWPALAVGDLDGDGKKEVIWGPVNNIDATANPNPARVVVFEVAGDGSDVLGVPDGSGNYLPNAKWNLGVADNSNERPFRWFVQDIDADSTEEIIFAARAGTLRWGVISVSDVPDNGDGSETWTMEASAATVTTPASTGTPYDLAILDSYIYLIYTNGNVIPIKYEAGTYTAKTLIPALVTGGSWKASSVVDIDNDGTKEIVIGGWNGSTGNVYLLQPNSDSLLTLTTIGSFAGVGATYMNGGAAGDIDGDGFIDFVFGSRTGVSNPNASVYRLKYLGGDITSSGNYEASIIDNGILATGGQFDIISLGNLDADAALEVVYSGIPRSSAGPLPIGIIDYNSTGTIPGGSKWDLAVVNNKIYSFDNDASVNVIQYVDSTWQVANKLTGVAGGYGSFKGSVVVDLNNDGVKEIVVGAWASAGAGKVYLLQEMNGGLKSTLVADLSGLGAVRLNGAGAGDIDSDGNMDIVFGSRASGGKIFRVEYIGGDITDANNYTTQMLDEGIVPAADQLDIAYVANLDNDSEMEIVYSGIPRSTSVPIPIVVLDILKIVTTPIADVKVDANADLQPDLAGQEFTILGVVTSINFTVSSNRFSYYVQDATGGINVTKSVTGGGPVYNIGDKLQVTGKVGIFRGLTQLNIDSLAQVVFVGLGTPVAPNSITLTDFMMDPEKYEGTLIKLNGVTKDASSVAWPAAAGSEANMTITDGNMKTTLRIDKDTDIDDSTEVAWPANIVGIATQYSSGSTVYDNGYQISPNFYADFTGGVKVPPSKYFMFTSETETEFNDTLAISAVDQQFVFNWHPSVDLNGDALIYQLLMIDGSTVKTFNPSPLGDTTITLTGSQLITALGNTSKTVQFTVRTKGSESTLVPSIDTLNTTFDILVGVAEENMIPTEFYVKQNYPNPFNPTTNIKFGLPKEATVDLRVYDILGREVAVLIDKQQRNAGTFEVRFDASRLATGTYIYRLSADNKVEIKKMLLIK